MKGITFSEFYDKLYYGADMDFFYKSIFYHISAGYENNVHSISVYEYDKHPDNKPSYYKEIYNNSKNPPAENIDAFINAMIFNNQALQQIEMDIEVIYSWKMRNFHERVRCSYIKKWF